MKKAITGDKLPKPVGPYSIAVQSGSTLFLSGQIPINSQGEIVSSSITDAVTLIMNNITEILKSAGMDLSHVVKTTVFSTSMDHFAEFNECYSKYFSDPYPARSFVEVSRLPRNALIEIEAIAVK